MVTTIPSTTAAAVSVSTSSQQWSINRHSCRWRANDAGRLRLPTRTYIDLPGTGHLQLVDVWFLYHSLSHDDGKARDEKYAASHVHFIFALSVFIFCFIQCLV